MRNWPFKLVTLNADWYESQLLARAYPPYILYFYWCPSRFYHVTGRFSPVDLVITLSRFLLFSLAHYPGT